MTERTLTYVADDGTPMTSQEQLALLIEISGLDSAGAASIAGVATSTIATYRKSSKARNVSPAILAALEAHALKRVGSFARAAGYELRRVDPPEDMALRITRQLYAVADQAWNRVQEASRRSHASHDHMRDILADPDYVAALSKWNEARDRLEAHCGLHFLSDALQLEQMLEKKVR